MSVSRCFIIATYAINSVKVSFWIRICVINSIIDIPNYHDSIVSKKFTDHSDYLVWIIQV